MTNTTAAATDSDDYSNIARGLSSVPINNLLLILGSIVLLSAAVCTFWQFSKNKGSEMSVAESPKDCSNTGNKKPPLPTHKSVRFADEELSCHAHVTPQIVPIPTKVSLAVGTDEEDEKKAPEGSSRSSSIVTSLFRSLSRSLSLYSIKSPKSESEDLEVEEPSHPRRRSRPLYVSDMDEHVLSDDSMNDLTDEISEESPTKRKLAEVESLSSISPRNIKGEGSMTRNRSRSEPIEVDENDFYVGEEVQYRGKSRWKRGIVTSINPLKVQGDGNYRARAYEQVRKLRVLPSKIGEEVDDMDVQDMTFDDFKRLMKSARRNTRASRHHLADARKSQAKLVDTLARNQK